MALQNATLVAEQSGISMTIHAALIEVEAFNTLLRNILRYPGRPTALFRLGYATEERPHSPRLSVEDVTEIMR